jgi:hypothetical protein
MSTPASNQALYSLNTLTEISLKPQVDFDQAPTVQGVPLGGGGGGSSAINPVRTTLTGDGIISEFLIDGASSLTNSSALIVSIDGAVQEPTIDYTVSNGTITFSDPLPSGSKAVVVSLANASEGGGSLIPDNSITTDKLANESVSRSKINSDFIQFKKLISTSNGSGNTYTKENDLSGFSIDTNSTYKVEIQLIASSNTDGIKCKITTPPTISTSVFNVGNAVDFSGAFKSLSYSNGSNTEIILFDSTGSIPQFRAFTGFFIFTANQSGILDFEWAKKGNTAGQTTSLLINTCIVVTKLST